MERPPSLPPRSPVALVSGTGSFQLLEQRLGVSQIARVEALGEPAVDLGEQHARRVAVALVGEQPRQARRRVQLIGFSRIIEL